MTGAYSDPRPVGRGPVKDEWWVLTAGSPPSNGDMIVILQVNVVILTFYIQKATSIVENPAIESIMLTLLLVMTLSACSAHSMKVATQSAAR